MNDVSHLEDLVEEAGKRIVNELGLFEGVLKEKARIVYDTDLTYSYYNFSEKVMFLNSDDLWTIYEETGHHIHNVINKYANKKFDDHGVNYDTVFYLNVLRESFGYFCSRLHGKDDFSILEEWLNGLEKLSKNYSIVISSISGSDDGVTALRPVEFYQGILRDLDLQKQMIDYGFKIYRAINKDELHDQISSELKFYALSIELINRKIKSEYYRIDSYFRIWHLLGYSLGDDLYDYWEDDPEGAIKLINPILKGRFEDSCEIFIKTYRELRKLSYAKNLLLKGSDNA